MKITMVNAGLTGLNETGRPKSVYNALPQQKQAYVAGKKCSLLWSGKGKIHNCLAK